jgi:hypothetical protein
MKKLLIILTLVLSFQMTSYSQTYKDWEDEDVEEFYEKANVKYGTLGEDGRKISFILVPTTMKQGVYEVEISDYKNDIYEIKGTDYYIKFRGYYGYAGYGDEGVLVVGSSAYSSTFYKKP